MTGVQTCALPISRNPKTGEKVHTQEKDLIKEYNNILQHAGRIKGITFLKKGGKEPLSSTAMHGKMKLLVPISDLIDIADELDRLEKQKITACKEINKSELKLNNTSFLSNAPIEIIEKEKQRISKNKNLLKELQKQIKKLSKTKFYRNTRMMVVVIY